MTNADLVWINLQMDSSANLILWIGPIPVGISARYAVDEVLDQMNLSRVELMMLGNGDIIPAQASRRYILDIQSSMLDEDGDCTDE